MKRAERELAALAALALGACTSEAWLGHWASAPLVEHDASVMTPIDTPAHGGASGAGDGHGDAPPIPDGGFTHANPVCLRNPSLDGIPHGGPVDVGTWWPPEAWDWCFNDPDDFPDPSMAGTQLCAVTTVHGTTTVDAKDGSMPVASLPPPTHGVGALLLDNFRGLPERTSQTMCSDFEPGFTYNFAIDLASRVGHSYENKVLGAGVLEIFGSGRACGHGGEPLWRSPPLTASFETYCVSITPSARVSVLTLQIPAKDQPTAAILVDNIRLSEGCGPAVVVPD